MNCPTCAEGKLTKGEEKRARTVGGRLFEAMLPAQKCANCGEVLFAGTDLEAFDRAVALRLAEDGVISGEAFQFIRKVAGLAAKELATLLDVTPGTVSRWENGRRVIDRAAWATLGTLLAESIEGRHTLRARLEAARRPRITRGTIRVTPVPVARVGRLGSATAGRSRSRAGR